jgi:hypothetical protein
MEVECSSEALVISTGLYGATTARASSENMGFMSRIDWHPDVSNYLNVATLEIDCFCPLNAHCSGCNDSRISTRSRQIMFLRNKTRPVRRDDNLAAICESIVCTMWDQHLTTLQASTACYWNRFTLRKEAIMTLLTTTSAFMWRYRRKPRKSSVRIVTLRTDNRT